MFGLAQITQRFWNIHRKNGKTISIIVPNQSTVRFADQIIVLENGKLIESGNHKQLFEQKGKYYDLWIKQFEGVLEDFW